MKSMHAMARQFVTDYIADYFNSKSWYQGTIDPDTFDAEQDSIFNEYETCKYFKDCRMGRTKQKPKSYGQYS